jgi:hypothetical protein
MESAATTDTAALWKKILFLILSLLFYILIPVTLASLAGAILAKDSAVRSRCIYALTALCASYVLYLAFPKRKLAHYPSQESGVGFKLLKKMIFFIALGIGCIPALFLFGILSMKALIIYSIAVLLISGTVTLVVLFAVAEDYVLRKIVILLSAFSLSYYALLGPFVLIRNAGERGAISLGGLVLVCVFLIAFAFTELCQYFYIKETRDTSGGDARSSRYEWVTANTKQYYRTPTKRETGEWKSPMKPLSKMLLLFALSLAVGFALVSLIPPMFELKPVASLVDSIASIVKNKAVVEIALVALLSQVFLAARYSVKYKKMIRRKNRASR